MKIRFFGIPFNPSKVVLGLVDSISVHKALPVLSTSKPALFLTLKLLGVNCFMILGSYYFYENTLVPLLDGTDTFNLSWLIYRSFWLLPICGLCYAISLVWYQQLADVIIEEFYTQKEKDLTKQAGSVKKKKKDTGFEHALYDLISWFFFYVQVQLFLKALPSIFYIADTFVASVLSEQPHTLSFSDYLSSEDSPSSSALVDSRLFIDSSSSFLLILCNLFSVLYIATFKSFVPLLSFGLPFLSGTASDFVSDFLASPTISSAMSLVSPHSSSTQIVGYASLLLQSNSGSKVVVLLLRQVLLLVLALLRLALKFYSNFLLSLLYSWYCFDLKWNTKKFSTKKKFTLLELNFNYFYGYGLPYVFLMSYCNFFLSFGGFLALFPFSIILGTINKYQRGKDDFLIEGHIELIEKEDKDDKKKTKSEKAQEKEDKAQEKKLQAAERKKLRAEKLSNKIPVFEWSQTATLWFIKTLLSRGKDDKKKDKKEKKDKKD